MSCFCYRFASLGQFIYYHMTCYFDCDDRKQLWAQFVNVHTRPAISLNRPHVLSLN